MTGELFINGKDAWTEWGINMGKGFKDTLDSFVPLKDYITNESALEHGRQVLFEVLPKVNYREFTLQFMLLGTDADDFREKRKAFEAELQKGRVDLVVPSLGNEVYKLVYLGKNITYAMNRKGNFGTVAARFEEPNPTDRA